MIIDVFSKYGWAAPLKNKSGPEVESALRKIFKENKPLKLWVDKGKEFYNKDVHKLLKEMLQRDRTGRPTQQMPIYEKIESDNLV